MARRFSDIRRAAKLNQALTNYVTYLSTSATRPSKLGTRGPLGLNKTVFVLPFTTEVGATGVCAARCRQDSFTLISPSIEAGSTKADVAEALGTKTLVSVPKFRASRIVFFQNATRVVTTPTSEITGLEYLKYAGKSYSCPFGATVDADDEMEAFLDIKAHLLAAFAASEVKRVSLSREYVGVD